MIHNGSGPNVLQKRFVCDGGLFWQPGIIIHFGVFIGHGSCTATVSTRMAYLKRRKCSKSVKPLRFLINAGPPYQNSFCTCALFFVFGADHVPSAG